VKKFLGILFLGLLFNLYIPVQALASPKDYLKGKFYSSIKDYFLVATEKMLDPRFKNAVIIMLHNDEKGAWGLAINKPLGSIPLGSLIYQLEETTIKKEIYNVKIPIFWGGPVSENKILILHSKEYKNETTKIYKNISISSDYKILFDIANKKGPKKSLVILGISSWGDGQLEGEMEREGWALSEINEDLIFEIDNTKKWLNAINNSFIRL